MEFKKHHLADKDEILCPLQHGISCNSWCAWFDHEAEDCRMIGGFMKVTEAINYLADSGINITIHEDKPVDTEAKYYDY